MKAKDKKRIRSMIVKRYGYLDNEAYRLYCQAFDNAIAYDKHKHLLPQHLQDTTTAHCMLKNDEDHVDLLVLSGEL